MSNQMALTLTLSRPTGEGTATAISRNSLQVENEEFPKAHCAGAVLAGPRRSFFCWVCLGFKPRRLPGKTGLVTAARHCLCRLKARPASLDSKEIRPALCS